MIRGVRLGRLVSMVLSVQMMAMRHMRVVGRFLMVTGRISFGRLFVVMRGLLMMMVGVGVALRCFL